MSTTWTPFVVVAILTATVVTTMGKHPRPALAVLYNSRAPDGPFQTALLKGVGLGLRDAAETESPLFLDLSEFDPAVGFDWILQNGTTAIISLLSSTQLKSFCHRLAREELKDQIDIFTPRDLPDEFTSINNFIKVTSLQMSEEGRIMALLHRIVKVGTRTLLPFLDDQSQLPLLRKYQEVSSKIFPQLQYASPIFTTQLPFSFQTGNVTDFGQGILLLSAKGLNEDAGKRLREQHHFFGWFSHEAFHEWDMRKGRHHEMFGLYSVQYVGSTNWDNPHRRRFLKEFSSFTGPDPTILSVVLAYDTASVAVAHLQTPISQRRKGSFVSSAIGLSGDLGFNRHGTRTHGVYFGIMTFSKANGSFGSILQPSDWILEDFLELGENNEGVVGIREYHVTTSSVFNRKELLHLAKTGKGLHKCSRVEMEVLTHDPFNQMEYRFAFNRRTLPHHILIPNEHGYGLIFRCHRKDTSSVTTLEIACTSNRNSIEEPVHCFKSGLSSRSKRSPKYSPARTPYPQSPFSPGTEPRFVRSHYNRSDYSPQEGNYLNYFQHPTVSSYYDKHSGFHGQNSIHSSTQGTKTTRVAVPLKRDHPKPTPESRIAHTSGGDAEGKLPELRQLLKVTKPFVGGCLGASSGCAMCILAFAQLPLGMVPAACTGSCMLGIFGTCGGLLARVVSESTVICTELFRQGLLELDTFLADAEFGRRLATDSPRTLLGYQILATPLVERMKGSEGLTKVVAYVALPWTRHMKYLIGRSDEFSWSGYLLHTLGSSVCYFFGMIFTFADNVPRTRDSPGYSFGCLLIGLILVIRQFRK